MDYFWEKTLSQSWYYQVATFHQESHLSFYMFLCLSSRNWGEPVGRGRPVRHCPFFLQHHVQQETANWSVKQGCSLQIATSWAHRPLNSLWQLRSQSHGGTWRPAQCREACSSPLRDMPVPLESHVEVFQWVSVVLGGIIWYSFSSLCVLTL